MELIIQQKEVESRIINIRGEQVLLDRDLAEFYGVEIKRLNEQVKRNADRFPDDFCFQLTVSEYESLRSQNATLENNRGKHRKYMPYVFTEEGVAAVSAVIKNEKAAAVSVQIMRAFVKMRRFYADNRGLFNKIIQIELKHTDYDQKFDTIFKALEAGQPKPEKGIFFEGQIFDAYVFVNDLIKKATKQIILIDNYVDESVLVLLSKRAKNVKATIYTKKISQQLELDLAKHNQQYPEIDIKNLAESHDRFLILDGVHLYHFGASLKDLGKKWFAFSQMDSLCKSVLQKLNH